MKTKQKQRLLGAWIQIRPMPTGISTFLKLMCRSLHLIWHLIHSRDERVSIGTDENFNQEQSRPAETGGDVRQRLVSLQGDGLLAGLYRFKELYENGGEFGIAGISR